MKENLAKKVKKDFDESYDERQVLERGKAFRNAYFTALLDVLILFGLNEFAGLKFIDPEFICYFLIWTTIAIFTLTAIRHDAFERLNDAGESRLVIILWGVCGAFILVTCIVKSVAYLGVPKAERDLGDLLNNTVAALCMLAVFVAYMLKRRKIGRRTTEE